MTRRVSSIITGAVVFLCCCELLATPAYYQVFCRVEKPPKKSQLEKARCRTCHVKPAGGKQLNSYGQDFHKNGSNEKALREIESLDSDQDGVPNKKEILEGTLPGDKTSKPDKL